MIINKEIIIFCLLTIYSNSFKDCNFSQYDFFSKYSLGQQDQLNKTFTILNKNINIEGSVEANVNTSLYKIQSIRPVFNYLDGKQRAQVVGLDIIYIKGGMAQTEISFNWSKNSQKGTGLAICNTDTISFAKLLYYKEGFLIFKLADYSNITFFTSNCNITRILPYLSSEDTIILQGMFNNNDGSNVKSLMMIDINKYYGNFLNQSLYDQRQPINNSSQYIWKDPSKDKADLVINYTMLPTGGHLNKNGLSLTFITQITDDDNWKCGASVPSSPKDIEVYGGIQQYLSLSIFENTIRYAIERGQFDTKLTQQKWQSKVFSFNAGDLYQIIPQIANKYYASTEIKGYCGTTTKQIKINIIDKKTFTFSLDYSCSLSIVQTKILSFNIDLTLTIQIRPQQSYLDFYVIKMKSFTHFQDEGVYKIHDLSLATLFLNRSLQRLYEDKVFGSGWKIYTRDYPKIQLQNGLLFIYDSASKI